VGVVDGRRRRLCRQRRQPVKFNVASKKSAFVMRYDASSTVANFSTV
jgi:hypothetical protein